MALKFFSGFETGDFAEWASVTGSPTVVEADGWGAPKTGDYCMRCNTDAATAYVNSAQDNIEAITFYLHIATTPDADCEIVKGYHATPENSDGKIILTDDRYIEVWGWVNTQFVHHLTSTTQLLEDTWYRVSVSAELSGVSLYINGVEEDTLATRIYWNTPVELGVITSCTADLYFDDIAMDSNPPGHDDLGDIRVLRASPNAAGEYAEFDTVSGYTYCDEVPSDGVTTIVDDSGVGALHRECYNLQDATTIGVGASDTVKAVNVLINYADAGETDIGIIVRDDGTDYTTVTGTVGKAYTWKNKLYDTNAPRASAWTPAIFTAFQSGGYNEGTKDMYMSTVMVMVAFIPVGVTDYPISLSPGLTASATVAYAVAWDRGMSPGLTATITIARALAYDRGTSPGLTVSTTIAKAFGRLITTTANLTVSSTVARFMTYTRAMTSNVTAAVTVAKSFGKKIATTANLVVSTTIAMSKGFVRAVTSNLTASTTVDRAVAYNRATTPGLMMSATIVRIVAYHISTQSVLSVAVSIVRSLGRTITTSPGLTVSATVVKSWGRTITTSTGLTVSATINRIVAYKRAVSSGLTTAVTIAKSFGKQIATSTNLAVSTTISRAVAYGRATNTDLSIAITALKSFGRKITTSSALTISTTIVRSVAYNKVVSAGLNIVTSIIATLSGVTNYPISLIANLSISTTVNRIVAYNRSSQTALSVAVSIVKSWGRAITTSADLAISTTISRVLTYTRATTAGLTIASIVDRTVAYKRAVSVGLITSVIIDLGRKIIELTIALYPRTLTALLYCRDLIANLPSRILSTKLNDRNLTVNLNPQSTTLKMRTKK